MSRVFVMSEHSSVVLEWLKEGHIPGLTHLHKPMCDDGKPNPWPDAVTDGISYGWFESDMILFWGGSQDSAILGALGKAGIKSHFIG